MGFKLLQERSMKAELLLVLLEHGMLACSRQPSSAAAQAAEAEASRGTQRIGGKHDYTPKNHNFCKFS
jgi:hypothetical protein